jgi:hypothetical protein
MGWVANATPRPLQPRERPGTHYVGGWVGPRAGVDRCGKTHPAEIRSLNHPACSESLYLLRYPDPCTHKHIVQNLTARNTKAFGNGRATFFGYGVEWGVLCYAIILESTRLLSLPSFLETTLMCEY